MRKWRRIYIVKQGLLRFIHAFKRKNKEKQAEKDKESKKRVKRNKMSILRILNTTEGRFVDSKVEEKGPQYESTDRLKRGK